MKTITLLFLRASKLLTSWIFLLFLFCSVGLMAQQPSADLDQVRNGTPSNPIVNPIWINGNVGASNAHFVEGFSIPYRCVMENLPVPLPGGTPYVEIIFEFDIKHSSKHAIDFITHYSNIEPHDGIFQHPAENINPLQGGYDYLAGSLVTYPIPDPPNSTSPNSPEPVPSFQGLGNNPTPPYHDLKDFTLYGGTFYDPGGGAVQYLGEGDLMAANSSQQFVVYFIPTEETAILSWGGRIGSQITWGTGNSAVNINGSPYHMRLIDWNLSNLGNQDRSCNADAVYVPPPCDFTGPANLCANEVGTFTVDNPNAAYTYNWYIETDPAQTASAFIDGSNTGSSVNVNAGPDDGTFTLKLEVTNLQNNEPITSTCGEDVTVYCPTPYFLNPPADETIQCADEISNIGVITWEDDCGNTGTVSATESSNGQTCPEIITRTWTYTDLCSGTTITHNQIITINDVTDPTWDQPMPADVTVECDAIPTPPSPITASDNCDDDVTVTYSEIRTDGSCPDSYTLTRTWTATDDCGNDIVHNQIITVEDTQAPTLSGCPTDVTVECDAVPAPATVTASDNCDDDVTVVFSEERTDGSCPNNYTLTRTWTATDDCGNSASCSQVITVEDTQAPSITPIPDYTFDCGEDIIIPYPTITDNCSDASGIMIYFSKTEFGVTTNYGPLPQDIEEWTDFEPGTTTEVCVWAVDECNNTSDEECFDVTINPCGDVYCTYTQGFYGNPGGRTCDGITTGMHLYNLLSTDLIVGRTANNRSMTIGMGDTSCVFDLLPGGGPAKKLNGNGDCTNPSLVLGKDGASKNTLFSQTLTLALNLRANPSPNGLGDLPLYDGHLRIAPSSDCDDELAYVTGPYVDYYIDSDVICYLRNNYNPNPTVSDILEFANDALAGLVPNGMMAKATNAAALINEAFDECMFGYFVEEYDLACTTSAPAAPPTSNDPTSTFLEHATLEANPNPFSTVANIEFSVPMTVRVELEVYTLQGQHVETLYSGMAAEDVIHTYQFHTKGTRNQATYIYILRTVYGTKLGKMIMIK